VASLNPLASSSGAFDIAESSPMPMKPATAKSPAQRERKRAGVHCDFKPAASNRKIRAVAPKDAKAAGKWAIEKYPETFRALAK
jgi:hypothetical protein